MSKSTVFDCFCGIGGLSIGAKLAGLTVVGGVDSDTNAIESFEKQFPGKGHWADLSLTSPKAVLQALELNRGDVDILVGGPPCQPYSVNNHQRGLKDKRCSLVARFLGFVSQLR